MKQHIGMIFCWKSFTPTTKTRNKTKKHFFISLNNLPLATSLLTFHPRKYGKIK